LEAVNKFIKESKILSDPNIRCFARSLVDNTLPLLKIRSANSILKGTVTEMAVHVATILLCGHNQILKPLRNLAFYPVNMAVRSLLQGFVPRENKPGDLGTVKNHLSY
jgi:hypothetical protein